MHRHKLYLYMPSLHADVVNYCCRSDRKMSHHNGYLIRTPPSHSWSCLHVARAGEVSTCRFPQLPVVKDGTASRLLADHQIRSIRHHHELSRSLQTRYLLIFGAFLRLAYIQSHIDAKVSSTEPSQPFIDPSQTCYPTQAVALPGA